MPSVCTPSPTNGITASDQILLQLSNWEKMEVMERTVQCTEAAHVSLLPTIYKGQSQYDTISHGIDRELAYSQSVGPSMTYLRNKELVQTEVEKR